MSKVAQPKPEIGLLPDAESTTGDMRFRSFDRREQEALDDLADFNRRSSRAIVAECEYELEEIAKSSELAHKRIMAKLDEPPELHSIHGRRELVFRHQDLSQPTQVVDPEECLRRSQANYNLMVDIVSLPTGPDASDDRLTGLGFKPSEQLKHLLEQGYIREGRIQELYYSIAQQEVAMGIALEELVHNGVLDKIQGSQAQGTFYKVTDAGMKAFKKIRAGNN